MYWLIKALRMIITAILTMFCELMVILIFVATLLEIHYEDVEPAYKTVIILKLMSWQPSPVSRHIVLFTRNICFEPCLLVFNTAGLYSPFCTLCSSVWSWCCYVWTLCCTLWHKTPQSVLWLGFQIHTQFYLQFQKTHTVHTGLIKMSC